MTAPVLCDCLSKLDRRDGLRCGHNSAVLCGWCGQGVEFWPSRVCEEPTNHILATYECDCGDLLRVSDDNLHLHRRCNLIGDRGYATTAVLLLTLILGSLGFLLVLDAGQNMRCDRDPDLAYCEVTK